MKAHHLLVTAVLCVYTIPIVVEAAVDPKTLIDGLDKLTNQIRKGNPLVEGALNTYNNAMDLYGKLDTSDSTFDEKHRPIELVVVNGLKRALRLRPKRGDTGTYFSSGKWFVHPQNIEISPGGMMPMFVSNTDGSVLTGVSGMLDYEIVGDEDKHFLVGFSNPQFGSYSTYINVLEDKTAKEAYETEDDDLWGDNIKSEKIRDTNYYVSAYIRKGKQGAAKLYEYAIMPKSKLRGKN